MSCPWLLLIPLATIFWWLSCTPFYFCASGSHDVDTINSVSSRVCKTQDRKILFHNLWLHIQCFPSASWDQFFCPCTSSYILLCIFRKDLQEAAGRSTSYYLPVQVTLCLLSKQVTDKAETLTGSWVGRLVPWWMLFSKAHSSLEEEKKKKSLLSLSVTASFPISGIFDFCSLILVWEGNKREWVLIHF